MENEGTKKTRYEWKNVLVGRNPDTGVKYFKRQKVRVVRPGEIPEEPPPPSTLTPPKDIGIPDWLAREKD
jgi:hypothetical protein